MKKMLGLTLVITTLLLGGCTIAQPAGGAAPALGSYRDIPGVTQEDVDALEALLASKPRLVYGSILSSETFIGEGGDMGGFTPLFCQRMSQLFGFEFELISYAWEDLVAGLQSYKIDLSGDLTPTPERMQSYYMTDAIAQRTLKVFTNRNAPSLEVTADERPIICAFLAGGITHRRVAESWDLPFEPVFIDDEAKVPEMLLKGEIDAFIEEGIIEASYDAYGFVEAQEYYPLTYSPVALTSGNPELAPLINIMQKYLKSGGASELAELYNQGYKDYLKNKLYTILSPQEKAYIKSHSGGETAILIACEADNYPASFYNAKLGIYQGVAIDVLEQVSALTGLRFVAANKASDRWEALMDGIESGEYSLVTELLRTPQREGRFLWADEPYYTDYYAMISVADYPDVDVNQILFACVGLIKDSAYADVFLQWFPDSVNTITYNGAEEAIVGLEKGEVDLLVATQSFLMHITNYLEKPGFKANVVFNYTTGSYLGFNKDEAILASIVNKAQRFINTEGITESWKRKVFDYERLMLAELIPYITTFAVVLLAAFFVAFMLLLKNKKISKNLEKLVATRTDELALQTATLRTIFDAIPDLVFCKDTDFRFTGCNKSFEAHFACREEDIIGQEDSAGMGMTEEEIEGFRAADKLSMRERRVVTVEEHIPAADGVQRYFETIKTPLIQNGEVVGVMGISRDITQRKTAVETLQLTLDNLDACIYITEIETGEILFINERMTREYNDVNCVGKQCWTVLQQGFDQRCPFCPVPGLLESEDKECVWEEHSTVTGKYYRNTDSIIKWHDGRDVHMQHSVDITDLIRLQKDLENASKAKSDFLSRMSHEIRTPLNAIIGMVNIAMGTTTSEKTIDCLVKANNASKHLLSLINDILDMSKIEADKYELDHREFSFEKMLINVANVTNFRAEEKGQIFIVDLGSNVPETIMGDDLRLSQVITNLLTNAVKFTPDGGTVKLSVSKTQDIGDNVELTFRVEDNGIGISPEQQARLFNSFEQADGSISRKFGGTGLGLAISKRIVELMGGQIWIESQLGQGSAFIFTVLVGKGQGRAGAKLSHKIDRDKLRILAVDDSPEVRDYFTHVMGSLGLPCDVAESGSQAIEMISGSGDMPYNIFFVDWQMPEMDGIELSRRIKSMTDENSVVFMISVAEWGNIEKEALAAGVKSFISKPLFPSTLVNAINECVEVKGTNTQHGGLGYTGQGRSYGGHRVLIAEDVEINREIMSAVLETSGLEIDYAEDGMAAVAMFTRNPGAYSLILMDIHMPEMDGYEATRRIRALDCAEAQTVPIIAMTANVFREDVENCIAAGMNSHIGKPIDTDNLYAVLAEYLHNSPDGVTS